MIRPAGRSSPRPEPVARPPVRLRAGGRPSIPPLVVLAAVTLALGGATVVARPALPPRAHVEAVTGGAAGRGAALTTRARMPDAPWIASGPDGRWVFGRGDRPPVRRLPADEIGLAIDRAFVASMVPSIDGHSSLRLRAATDGHLVTQVDAPIWVSAAAFTPSGLVVTGYGDGSMASDGGLLLVVPSDGRVTTLVGTGRFAEKLGSPVARGDVLVSPSGRMVASNACGLERCDLQVVDLATGAVTRPITDAAGFLRAVTDELVVTTDDAGRWIRATEIGGGRQRWQRDAQALIEPAVLADGSIVGLIGSIRTGWAISTIDSDGHARDLSPRTKGDGTPPHLWRSLMSSSEVVYGALSFEEALGSHRSTTVTVLTPGNGHASNAAVQLPSGTETIR